MSFGQEIVNLFKNMPALAIICLVAGIILIIIEIFEPGFGVFGILGGILTIAGIVLRVIVRDGNILIQILIIVMFDVAIAGIAVLVMFILSKNGLLKKSPFVQSGVAVNKDRSPATADDRALLGMMGVAVTTLHPAGKVEIDGITYDVVSNSIFIEKGEIIKVINVEGAKITVVGALHENNTEV